MSPAPVVLGIETSCDETAAAVVRGGRVLSSVVSSQADLHSVYSGVIPELASRAHMERVASVMERAVRGAFGGAPLSSAKGRLGAVAFTRGPGLAGALVQIVSAPFAILVDAVSFAVSAISLVLIRSPEPERPPRTSATRIAVFWFFVMKSFSSATASG